MHGANEIPPNESLPSWLEDETFMREATRVVDQYKMLVGPLAAAFGPTTEVVLHDLSRLPNSVVAIAGSVSHRQVGSPATDLGLKVFVADEPPENMIGYRTEMPDGVVCRSSSIFLYGDHERPVAALCINSDIRGIMAARDVLDHLAATPTTVPAEGSPASGERFYGNVEELADDLLKSAISSIGSSVEEMSKAQKVRVVGELKRRGFFIIREAVDIASEALGVSRYTIYNYLNEIS